MTAHGAAENAPGPREEDGPPSTRGPDDGTVPRDGRPADVPANAGGDAAGIGGVPRGDGLADIAPASAPAGGSPVLGDGSVNIASALEPAVNPLQRLISRRLYERGWSYGDVARRSGLPRSTVYTLATTRNLVRPPRPATINGLAAGLDVPVSAVRAAAAESTGLHYYDAPRGGQDRQDRPHAPGDQERELLIASIDELSPEDRRHVAALVESLRNRPAPPPDPWGDLSRARPATRVPQSPDPRQDPSHHVHHPPRAIGPILLSVLTTLMPCYRF